MSASKIGLEKRVGGIEGRANPGGSQQDVEYAPFENHPLVSILRHPNKVDTWPTFLAKIIIQYYLTGRVMIWGPHNKAGAPGKLFVVPTALVVPVPGLSSNIYPLGGYRIQPFYPAGLIGVIPTAISGMLGVTIDARNFYIIQNPHPLYNWSPVSPTQANQVSIDLLEMIDRSCWSVMQNGVNPSVVIDMPGATKEVMDAARAEYEAVHSGPDNHGKAMFFGGGDPTRPAAVVNPTKPSADVMGFSTEWERVAGQTLAGVFGINLSTVGLKTTGSYAEDWAEIQRSRISTYEPFLGMVANTLTDGPVKDWGLSRKGIRCSIVMPKLDDPTIVEQQNQAGAVDGTMMVNEIRVRRGLKPVDGGDVLPSIFTKLQEQAAGVDMVSQQERLELAEGTGEVDEGGVAAVTDGGSEEPPRPENKGGKGTLPPRPSKGGGKESKSLPDPIGKTGEIPTGGVSPVPPLSQRVVSDPRSVRKLLRRSVLSVTGG